jgi:geranylgeranylglycerol-phosphate geranylgeranyltransferase
VIFLRTVWYLLVLIRPHNCLIATGSVLVGAFLAEAVIGTRSVEAALTAFFACAGAYVLNDIFDIPADSVSKPWRPLVSGKVARVTALQAVVVLWAAGLAFALLAGRVAAGFYLVWLVLLYLYSWRLKASGLPGHIAVSLVAASGFLLGGSASGDVASTFIPFVIATLFHLAREVVKSVADAEGDRRAGISTLAVRIGGTGALGLVLWSVVAVIGVSFLPFALRIYGYLYMLAVGLVIYPLLVGCIRLIVLARAGRRDIERASESAARLLKVAMPVGLLAFFLAGV